MPAVGGMGITMIQPQRTCEGEENPTEMQINSYLLNSELNESHGIVLMPLYITLTDYR